MAARRPLTVCLRCQTKQLTLSRRPLGPRSKRHLTTAAEENAISHDIPPGSLGRPGPTSEAFDAELLEARRTFDDMWSHKETRVKVLASLSNPWPKVEELEKAAVLRRNLRRKTVLPEANAGPIPHHVFRERLFAATDPKTMRKTIREQLLRCTVPKDIYRVMAACLYKRSAALQFSKQPEPMMRAIYRLRHSVDDPKVLRTINTIINRLRFADLPVPEQFYHLGLKFAARTRSVEGMKRYLRHFHQGDAIMTDDIFRSVVAKFSIGHRGLGEIRNGRWKRDDLYQVLKGFDNMKHLPMSEQFHLETFLNRDEWGYFHGWIVVLSRCKALDDMWQEWELWKQNRSRLKPRNLANQQDLKTTRDRGDYWFIENMTYAGSLDHAWQILKETRIPFKVLTPHVRSKLLDRVDLAAKYGLWNTEMQEELILKMDIDLMKIEANFGVRWVSTSVAGDEDSGEGYHVLVDDQETALERLSGEDWQLEPNYGYPHEESQSAKEKERSLHNAPETTPA